MRSISVLAGLSLVLSACGGSDSPAGPQATLSVTVSTFSISSGNSVQAVATISDGSGGSTPATGVTWSTSSPNIASVSSTGLITGTLKGNAIITAKSGSMTGQVSVQVVPGAPATVIIYAGNAQSRPRGSQLTEPLCTNVKDAAGNIIIGVGVTYTVMTGGGQLASPNVAATDAGGISTSGLWTLGPTAGSQTVMATVPGATSVTFTATAQ
jgi:hypothetical protein